MNKKKYLYFTQTSTPAMAKDLPCSYTSYASWS